MEKPFRERHYSIAGWQTSYREGVSGGCTLPHPRPSCIVRQALETDGFVSHDDKRNCANRQQGNGSCLLEVSNTVSIAPNRTLYRIVDRPRTPCAQALCGSIWSPSVHKAPASLLQSC